MKRAVWAILLAALGVLLWLSSGATSGLSLRFWAGSAARGLAAVTSLEIEGVGPIRLFLNPDDHVITPALWADEIWERTETHWFVRSVRPGDVVVDVGANVGYYTVIAGRLVGDAGRVYAFEPDPVSFALLERNVRLNGLDNVVLEQKAVSSEPGSIQLFIAKENKGDHRIYQPEGETRLAIDVAAVSLDGYFEGREESVDFVKIDTQGAEVAILRGMRKLLARSRELVMAIEYAPHLLAGFDATGRQLLSELAPAEPELFDLGIGGSRLHHLRRAPLEGLLRMSPESEYFTNLLVVRGRSDLIERIRTEDGVQ